MNIFKKYLVVLKNFTNLYHLYRLLAVLKLFEFVLPENVDQIKVKGFLADPFLCYIKPDEF